MARLAATAGNRPEAGIHRAVHPVEVATHPAEAHRPVVMAHPVTHPLAAVARLVTAPLNLGTVAIPARLPGEPRVSRRRRAKRCSGSDSVAVACCC